MTIYLGIAISKDYEESAGLVDQILKLEGSFCIHLLNDGNQSLADLVDRKWDDLSKSFRFKYTKNLDSYGLDEYKEYMATDIPADCDQVIIWFDPESDLLNGLS